VNRQSLPDYAFVQVFIQNLNGEWEVHPYVPPLSSTLRWVLQARSTCAFPRANPPKRREWRPFNELVVH